MKKSLKKYTKWTLLIGGAIFLAALIIAPFLRDMATLSSHFTQCLTQDHQGKICKALGSIDYKNIMQRTFNNVSHSLDNGARNIDEGVNKLSLKITSKDKDNALDSTLADVAKSSLTSNELALTLHRNYAIISQATYDTMYMVFAAIIFAVVFGLPLGVLLSITKAGRILTAPSLNTALGSIVNVVRSFPFIILIVLLLPLSKILVGSMIGATAAIVPLGIAAIPFIARLFEGVFEELDKGLIEASVSMGASRFEVVKMMIAECLPGLVNAIIITIIGLIGYSAMAGALGAGGLGDVAIRLGFQGYEEDILFSSVIVIIVLVQWIQSIGDCIVLQLRKKH